MRNPSFFLVTVVLALSAVQPAAGQDRQEAFEIGNVIFFHPDGAGLNHWNAASMDWYGPDGVVS